MCILVVAEFSLLSNTCHLLHGKLMKNLHEVSHGMVLDCDLYKRSKEPLAA